ncbi:expressed unknown protein [Seminavis robusta]|uniref:Uncharacterized protein n=1 Tax=Seminavis robusta TaxID=568900 RepID=A0A9N8ED27_9STRA|nr:expressed unknown protein [Seminavis robusta]|eukprot:Sro998_g229550.1 n/a (364) ;mRNA; r:30088-31179
MASQLWNRMAILGRDGVTISRAFAQAVSPILRRQDTHTSFSDAFRNVIVSQARQSNQVAASLLSLQQQIGLIQYHGVSDYLRQRQGLLQSSSSSSGGGTTMSTTSDSTSPPSSAGGNVAKVAFMITTAMRIELTESLGYTAEGIKSLTPKEASLILHHSIKPEMKEEQLPGILEAYEAEKEKFQQEQEKIQQEQERQQEQEKLELAAQKEMETKEAPPEDTKDTSTMQEQENNLQLSGGTSEKEQESTPQSKPTPFSLETPTIGLADKIPSNSSSANGGKAALGDFVSSMDGQSEYDKQEWYEVVETRTGDKTSSPVLLFSTKAEADEAMELKETFAERRAKEDKDNQDNIPATTYSVNRTLK